MDTIEFWKMDDAQNLKDDFDSIINEINNVVSGRCNSVIPFITDEHGMYSKTKVNALIEELVGDMDEYAVRNMIWPGSIIAEDALPEQKYFCRYVRLYIYLALRVTMFNMDSFREIMRSVPYDTFNVIYSGCIDFHSEKEKEVLLAQYFFDGVIYDGLIGWCIEIYGFLCLDGPDSWMTESVEKRMSAVREEMESEYGMDSFNDEDSDNNDYLEPIDDGTPDQDYVDFELDNPVFETSDPMSIGIDSFQYPGGVIDEPEVFCDSVRELTDLLFSDKIPISYFSNMKIALKGMLEIYMIRHDMSMFCSEDKMNKVMTYMRKTVEKTKILNGSK